MKYVNIIVLSCAHIKIVASSTKVLQISLIHLDRVSVEPKRIRLA